MIDRMPTVVDQLLGHIPRLEPVRRILAYQHKRYDGSGSPRDGVSGEAIPWGARALKVALDLDALEAQGVSTVLAFDTLRGRKGWYDPAILEAFAQVRGNASQESEVRELELRQLAPGMVFVQDVRTRGGLLVIARGQEVTASLLERVRNFSSGLQEPIRVIVRNLSRGSGASRSA
jgi:hypothetical protein